MCHGAYGIEKCPVSVFNTSEIISIILITISNGPKEIRPYNTNYPISSFKRYMS